MPGSVVDTTSRGLLLAAKRLAAQALCAAPVGHALSLLYRDHVPSRGCLISARPPLVSASTRASLYWGLYESAEIRFVQRWLRTDLDVIELGSSLGVVAAHIARRLAPGRQLICVEPDPRLVDTIRENVLRNAPGARLTVLQNAIDERGGAEASLIVGAETIHSRLGPLLPGEQAQRVPCCRLADVVARLEGAPYALVCDIEGAEAGLVASAAGALAGCRQLIIELHQTRVADRIVTVEEMREALEASHGFELRARNGPVCVLERPMPGRGGP